MSSYYLKAEVDVNQDDSKTDGYDLLDLSRQKEGIKGMFSRKFILY